MGVKIPLESILEGCGRVEAGATRHMEKAMRRVGKAAVEKAKDHTPVETGHLRGKWRYRTSGRYIIIENRAKYAVPVNYGHRQTPGGYVPALGKRLKKDYVSGFYMLEKAIDETEKHILPEELRRAAREIIEEFK